MNKYKQITIVALALVLGPVLAHAWTSAPSSPPAGNVSAPVNVGGTYQHKTGILQVGVLGVDGGGLFAGDVGIGLATTPGYRLQVGASGDGSSIGANAFYYFSDARLKNNVTTLTNSLEKVLQLRGVSFDWKDAPRAGKKNIGVVAQEIEAVYPELVNTDANGIKSVQEGNLVAPLIEAVKVQQAEIQALKARISALEAGK